MTPEQRAYHAGLLKRADSLLTSVPALLNERRVADATASIQAAETTRALAAEYRLTCERHNSEPAAPPAPERTSPTWRGGRGKKAKPETEAPKPETEAERLKREALEREAAILREAFPD
jgi:hypothetical protein